MANHNKNTIACLIALAALFFFSGCASNLYLTESEVAAFTANMRTADRSTNLMDDLAGHVFDLRFTTNSSGRLVLASSNTLEMLERIGAFNYLSLGTRQISLARLAAQLDQQFTDWLHNQRMLIQRRGGSHVRVTELSRAIFGIQQAPQFEYDANAQAIRFNLQVTASMNGRLYHRIFGNDLIGDVFTGLGNLFSSGSAEGENPVRITVGELTMDGAFYLHRTMAGGMRVDLEIETDEQNANIVVAGGAPGQVRSAIREVVQESLTPTHRESHTLDFNFFSIPQLVLLENADGETELFHVYVPKLETAVADVDVVMRSREGRLYHTRRIRREFAEPVQIPLQPEIAGDPALVTSAPGVLELVVVADNGDLVHARRQNNRWRELWHASDFGALKRYRAGDRIALASTGPGQLEIVAVGDSGYIYHIRQKNGVWQPQTVIAELNSRAGSDIRDPLFVRLGFKLLLICWDGNRKAWGAVFDIASGLWAQPFEIGTSLAHAPAAVALEDWEVGVAYNTRNGDVHYRRVFVQSPLLQPGVATAGASMGSDRIIGSNMDGPPELVQAGYSSAVLAIRGRNRELKVNRVAGNTWLGWDQTDNVFFGTPTTNGIGDEFSMASTASGQIHFVGKRSSRRSRLLYNQHPGFGHIPGGLPATSPIHWRGHQEFDQTRYPGKPALAVGNRTAAMAVVDESSYPWTGVLGDSPPSSFKRTGLRTVFDSDPAVVSPHVGQIDLIFVGEDEKLKHAKRYFEAQHGYIANLPQGPSGFAAVSAVASANQIDVVALGKDRSLYYMRNARGAWNGIVGLGSNILSRPAIVDVGSGQLEIFAVNAAHELWRWQLKNGGLTPGERIRVPFEVSPVLFGPGSISSYGNGTVDIVVAKPGTGQVYHARFLPDRPQPINPAAKSAPTIFLPVGVMTLDIPVITALESDRVHLLVPGEHEKILSGWFLARRVPNIRKKDPRTQVPSNKQRQLESELSPAKQDLVSRRDVERMLLGWGPFSSIYTGSAQAASLSRLSDAEFAVPIASRSGELLLRRYRGGSWQPGTAISEEPDTLPDNRPSRVLSSIY